MKNVKSFSKITKKFEELGIPKMEVPNLIQAQINSYNTFLQREIHPAERQDRGLQYVFNTIFPVRDTKGFYRLEFIEYVILKEKYDTEECVERNLTYNAPIRAKMRLVIHDEEALKTAKEERVKSIVEQDVYLGDIPLITSQGTFIINGAERVIISQVHRSPGVFLTEEESTTGGKPTYSAKVIPQKGSWIEFVIDTHDVMYVYIDNRRKLPVTTFLRYIGISSDADIRKLFYKSEEILVEESKDRYLSEAVYDLKKSKSMIADANTLITDDLRSLLLNEKITKIKVVASDCEHNRKLLENSLAKDNSRTQGEAAIKIYNQIKPNEDVVDEVALAFLDRIFFDDKRYSLGEVGRYKVNKRLKIDIPDNQLTLTNTDIIAIVSKLIEVYKGDSEIDDIDHLANRRIRTIGELMEEQYQIGLSRVARTATERLSIANSDEVTVHEIINPNALTSVVNSFFLTGQLSQFMEQTNPLAAIKHKRALSALGPGGLARDRAGFEVRDVHYSHYGRICPIETPEGPNIGLIVSPALFSKLNRYGFLETPYIKIEDGKVTSEVVYLDPLEEDEYIIAQANANIDEKRFLSDELIFAREKEDYVQARPIDVQYMDVAPQQIVSVSAALIPFLEHDDANRALMGSNMQRQSVPLLYPEAPIIGTGLEKIVARDSGTCAVAPYDGIISNVTSAYIDIVPKSVSELEIDLNSSNRIYLKKFLRSNQDTCVNQKPIVEIGQEVIAGQQISDGPCIENDRLALGRNLIVAFMPWFGYNYEDAIILNENVAREDILTSIYIEVQEVMVRNTKTGKEELAYDIPNVPVQSARNLDKTGIIRVGSAIRPGDIIVGKITPKSVDIDPSPEETLMRALFGDRAGDFQNTSLKAKPGMEGVVIDVKVFSRFEDNVDYEEERKEDIARIKREKDDNTRRIDDFLKKRLTIALQGETAQNILDEKGNHYISPGKKITSDDLKKINFKKLNLEVEMVESSEKNKIIYYEIVQKVKAAIDETENIHKKKRERLKHGDELQYGVLKMVKVYIAKKRKVQVGDKMAGRHGNKGVISKICPIEDMPFMSDGTPVDIILNPLGVPSRMNIGQIMETHLGMAAKTLGYIVETPVFDGAEPHEIAAELKKAGLPEDGKQLLYDGKTGEPFRERVTVGVIYMLKLNHLVADKMHARSTGPYSLITQQPLGGKAQHGGQRLGEMEVWALEAYGAAGLLEEMLTIKSDDVDGRTNAYKAITTGQNVPKPGTPESFNVLISELKSLCFDIDFLTEKDIRQMSAEN
ncbi:MAG: DNA-directed RNA polymerase subunit beta [Candidatus Cloacimonetes bacterium]|nr:DNA-directed RNA polymerase subunit beta [Candidatus Cloacimonadota bacterium]